MDTKCATGSNLLEQSQLKLPENLSSCLPIILIPEFSQSDGRAETDEQFEDLMRPYNTLGLAHHNLNHGFLRLPDRSECHGLYELARRIGQIPIRAELKFKTSLGLWTKDNLRQACKPGLSLEELVALTPNPLEARQYLASVKDQDAQQRLVHKVQQQLFAQACYLVNLVGYWQMLGVSLAYELTQDFCGESVNQVIRERIEKARVSSMPEGLSTRVEREAESLFGLYQLFQPFQQELEQGLLKLTGEKVNLTSQQAQEDLLLNCLAANFTFSWESGPLNTEKRPTQKEHKANFSHWIYALKQQSFRERKSQVKKLPKKLLNGDVKTSKAIKQEPTAPTMEGYVTDCEKRREQIQSWTDNVFKVLHEAGQIGSNRDHWYGFITQLDADKELYFEQLYWREGLPYKTLGERTPKRVFPHIISGHIVWRTESH